MNGTLKTQLGILGAIVALSACGRSMKIPFFTLPVGAQVNLLPFSQERPNRIAVVELSRGGKPVLFGEVAFFSGFAAKTPFMTENLATQRSKDCAAIALDLANPDFGALVFCDGTLKPSGVEKMEFVDSAGTVSVASHLRFLRSDTVKGVDVFSVDFL